VGLWSCGAGTLALMGLLSRLDQHQIAPHHRLGVRSSDQRGLLGWICGYPASITTPRQTLASFPTHYPTVRTLRALVRASRRESSLQLLALSCSYNMANETTTCAHCKKSAEDRELPSLKACARCKTALYCGRDCQKADYKSHKKVCPKALEHSNSYSTPRLHDLEQHIPDPFTRLDKGTYLHDRPEIDTFKLLIDSFRIRQSDDFGYENKSTPPSIYTGAPSSTVPFRQYLDRATACKSSSTMVDSGEDRRVCDLWREWSMERCKEESDKARSHSALWT
jgi:hypothetical protein